MKENVITLRIFSGTHLGAEITLPEGLYVLGNDDSCDIILQDTSLEARHIQLKVEKFFSSPVNLDSALVNEVNEIRENTNEQAEIDVHFIRVQIQNLDGVISLYGEIIENENFLEARTPYYIGQTCFAWTECGAFDYSWNTVSEKIQKSIPNFGTKNDTLNNIDENTEKNEQDFTETADSQSTDNSNLSSNKSDNLNLDANKVASEIASGVDATGSIIPSVDGVEQAKTQQISFYQNKTYHRYGLYFVAILLLLSLTITIKETYALMSTKVILLEKSVNRQGFSHLTILENESGIILSGILKDDVERAKVVRLAQNMHFSVYLDLKIQDDLLKSLEAAYNGEGFYPKIDIITDGNQIVVSGYLKDKLLLHVIDTYVQKNIPALKNQTIEYNVHYADELQKILSPRLSNAKLDFFNIQYLLGTLSVTADFTEENKKIFGEIMDTISLELQIPIKVLVTSVAEKQLERLKGTVGTLTTQQAAELNQEVSNQLTDMQRDFIQDTANKDMQGFASQQVNTDMRFDVSSVTLNPIKYIILSTGERVFEGGLLPGNYVLKKIDLKHLTLNKNGIKSKYYLK